MLTDVENPSNTPELFELIPLDSALDFTALDPSLQESLHLSAKNYHPCIFEMFSKILTQCLQHFDFLSNPISFEEYMAFYREVNRLIPELKKKIIIDDTFSSVFYVGDTHGAIHESFWLVDFFFKLIQKDDKIKIVFVGDYVDRNPYDLENLTLIVAFSLLFPKHVLLIRGNHEDRVINQHYGFINNLLRTFYDQGEILYGEIVSFFTHLPLLHITQMHSSQGQVARILTTHAGIPVNLEDIMTPISLEELESLLQCEVEESKDMDNYSSSILWSDPDEDIKEVIAAEYLSGRMRFGYPIFENFMKKNNLSILIRGHQKWTEGYHIFFLNKVYQIYSLFSTATYDGKVQFHPKLLQIQFKPDHPVPPTLIEISSQSLDQIYQNYL